MPRFSRVCAFLLPVLIGLSACTPSLSPLYRDFRVEPEAAEAVDLRDTIRVALQEAGWAEAASAAPNAVSTEPRKVAELGLYRVEVAMDVVPVHDRHVRIFFHPYRIYLFGGRTKIPFLNKSLQNALLSDLSEAFARHGLAMMGTPVERDQEQARR